MKICFCQRWKQSYKASLVSCQQFYGCLLIHDGWLNWRHFSKAELSQLSSAQLKIITFQSHTVLVKQAFGLKYAEHSNTEHCAPQQSGLYHRTLSVTHPNHTKPKNRGCDVPKYTQSMSWCMLSHQVSNATGPLDHGCADHTFCSCQCSEVYLLKLWM